MEDNEEELPAYHRRPSVGTLPPYSILFPPDPEPEHADERWSRTNYCIRPVLMCFTVLIALATVAMIVAFANSPKV